MGKRGRLEIIAEILYYCNGSKRTISDISRAIKLSYDRAANYVYFLEEKGYLKRNGDRYTTSEKGLDLLSRIEDLIRRIFE